jgi:polysaccharide deacetylase family protein (PEP-CTERM system associated)
MNILTFDIEEWYHLLDINCTRDEKEWLTFETRIYQNVDRIIDFLVKKNVSATFFCLGWIAERFPDIIKKIDQNGFEIASHSFRHQLAYEQTPQQFSDDLKRSIDILEQCTGKKVITYRVPGFSFTEKNTWVYDILIEHGIQFDSSIFPGERGHGGFSSLKSEHPFIIKTAHGSLKEFPISLKKIWNRSLAFSGGGYFRLIPYFLLKYFFKQSPYVMTYFHPRDFDDTQPIIRGLPASRKFKSYVGLKAAFNKFSKLINDFRVTDIRSAVKQINWDKADVVEIGESTPKIQKGTVEGTRQ